MAEIVLFMHGLKQSFSKEQKSRVTEINEQFAKLLLDNLDKNSALKSKLKKLSK